MRTTLFALPLALLVLLCGAAQAGNIDETAALSALSQPGAVLIDVRTPEEFSQGALPGAKQIEFDKIAGLITAVEPDKSKPIILYCQSGRRAGIAQQTLNELGYHNVINAGGYKSLSRALDTQHLPSCSSC